MSDSPTTQEIVGQPIDRVDGRAKVTGGARYSAEFAFPNLVHAVLVQSTIAKGRIKKFDLAAAKAAPGVLSIMTYENAPSLHPPKPSPDGRIGESLLPMQSNVVNYDGQIIGMVVADTFDRAMEAAKLINITYEREKPVHQLEQNLDQAYEPKQSNGEPLQLRRGDPAKAFQDKSLVAIDHTYVTPVYHHNAMEPHASVAVWEGDNLTVYASTQGVVGYRDTTASLLGLEPEHVRVISLYVGGGFGSKGFVWYHPALAALAAKAVGRPVKLVHTRQQMFTLNGHRSRTIQNIALAAKPDGELVGIRHKTTSHTSEVSEFTETCGLATSLLYTCPNLEMTHKLVKLNVASPCPARAPGEATGVFALEVAMDELAYELKMDPIALRLKNYAEAHPGNGRPFSSKNLRECYLNGAEAFGWSKRDPRPMSMKDGRFLVGYGMATATYPARRGKAEAKVQIFADGKVVVSTASQDIGTGTYTILTQIAADALGLPVSDIECKIGDTALPRAPTSGGSRTASTVGPAVRKAALEVKSRLVALAADDRESALFGRDENALIASGGRVHLRDDPSKGATYAEIMQRAKTPSVIVETSTAPATGGGPGSASSSDGTDDTHKFAFQSFGAQFAEVRVDPLLGQVRLTRMFSAIDVGRILNEKTARSQVIGGAIFGAGMALMEETIFDPPSGRIVTRNLADYHVPVNADIPDMDVLFTNKPDLNFNPLGCRGVGEIGITGMTAAIANAVFHAVGKRVRDLPITPDKLIA